MHRAKAAGTRAGRAERHTANGRCAIVKDRRDHRAATEFFQSGAGDYDRAQYASAARSFIADRNALLLDLLGRMTPGEDVRLLEVGCGPGHFLARAWSHCAAAVAVDTSCEMLELTRARLPEEALASTRLARASITALPFPANSFDIVVSAGVIEYFPDAGPPLGEIHRVLRPGGRALLPITNRLSPALVTVPLLDRLKRMPVVMRPFNSVWTALGRAPARPRHFRVRFDTPAKHRRLLADLGFEVVDERFFHLAPLPHPIERLAPRLVSRILDATDALLRSPVRVFAEGYIAVATKA